MHVYFLNETIATVKIYNLQSKALSKIRECIVLKNGDAYY
jgi:hypothetical protein